MSDPTHKFPIDLVVGDAEARLAVVIASKDAEIARLRAAPNEFDEFLAGVLGDGGKLDTIIELLRGIELSLVKKGGI